MRTIFFLVLFCFSSFAFSQTDINNADHGVVLVLASGGGDVWTGSSFVVAEGDILATNNHVVEGAEKIEVGFWQDNSATKPTWLPATVIWTSKGLDLALIQVPNLNRHPLVLSEKLPIKGSKVISIGFPGVADSKFKYKTLDSTLTEGVVGRVFENPWATRNNDGPNLTIIQHSATINHGNSGGPLLDGCGHVVGINTQIALDKDALNQTLVASAGINYASDISYILEVLKSKGLKYSSSSSDCIPGAMSSSSSLNPSLVYLIIFIALALACSALIFALRKNRVVVETFTQFKRRSSNQISSSPLLNSNRDNFLLLVGHDSLGNEVRLTFSRELGSGEEIVIGRDRAQSTLSIDDPTLSRQHASFKVIDGVLMVRDLGSTNGSSIDGASLLRQYRPLKIGQQISFGKVQLKIIRDKS